MSTTTVGQRGDGLVDVGWISPLGAAGLCQQFDSRRRRAAQRRRPGYRLDSWAHLGDLEVLVGLRADPEAVARLDTALRTLAATTTATGAPLPRITAAVVSGRDLQLLLADPAVPLAPFTSRHSRLRRASAATPAPAARPAQQQNLRQPLRRPRRRARRPGIWIRPPPCSTPTSPRNAPRPTRPWPHSAGPAPATSSSSTSRPPGRSP
jgi:hypothetical protein